MAKRRGELVTAISIAGAVVVAIFFVSLFLTEGIGGERDRGWSEGPAPAGTAVPGTPEETLVIVNSLGERVPVRVEVADTRAEQDKGLGERTELAPDAGMLFAFEQEQRLSFWATDALIPLSLAYIDAEGRILDIQDMQPLGETAHLSAEPAQYALEVNRGFFEERGINIGDTVGLPQRSSSAETASSADVIQAFREADLEVGESYPVEQDPTWEENYSVPKTYEEATYFGIPSLGRDPSGEVRGGRVFVFGSEGDLAAVRDYWEGRNYETGADTRIYVEGNVLLQITQYLPEAEAERYEAVLKERVAR